MASFNVSDISNLTRFVSPQLQATQTSSSRVVGTSLASQLSASNEIAKLLPGILGLGGAGTGAGSAGSGTGGSASGSGGTGSTTVGSGAGTGPGDIAMLVGDIPIANDGDVITADYHNTLREAIQAIASFLGSGASAQASIETLAPALLDANSGNDTPWSQTPQAATASGMFFGLGSRDGWMPIDLPDGVTLQSLSVVDERTSSLSSLVVTLGRYSLSDPTADPITLATVSEGAGNGTVTTDTAQVSVAGISDPNVTAGLARVDNSSYRYFIRASAAWANLLQLQEASSTATETQQAAASASAGGLTALRMENPAVRSFANSVSADQLNVLVHQAQPIGSDIASATSSAASQTTLVHEAVPASPPETEEAAPSETVAARDDLVILQSTYASLYAFQIAYTLW